MMMKKKKMYGGDDEEEHGRTAKQAGEYKSLVKFLA